MDRFTHDLAPRTRIYFDVRLQNHTSDLLVEQVDVLRGAMRQTMHRYPFTIDAIVVLPAEILTIWTLPRGDKDYATRWAMIKSLFLRNMRDADGDGFDPHRHRRDHHVWQRRIIARPLRSRYDFDTHCTYIHMAPVSCGLVSHPELWPHTSLHREMLTSVTAKIADPTALRLPWSARARAAARNAG